MVVAAVETLRRSHLSMAQMRDHSGQHTFDGDLLILVSSWERRCLEATKAQHGQYLFGALIRFAEMGCSGRRADHDQSLLAQLSKVCDVVLPVEMASVKSFAEWREAIHAVLAEARRAIGRPLDLVVDASCLPKYYVLLLIGTGLGLNLVRSMKIIYAEGRYSPSGSTSMLSPEHQFTSGAWYPLPVPYLEGQLSPNRKNRVIAAVGFETFQARSFITAYEPEKFVLIAPQPGFSAEYDERSRQELDALCSHLDIPVREVVWRHAGGALQVCDAALGFLDRSRRHTDIGLCLGTKPHAIGLGMAALLRPYFTIVCRIPEAYVETETPANGKMWRYDLVDLSVPHLREEVSSQLAAL